MQVLRHFQAPPVGRAIDVAATQPERHDQRHERRSGHRPDRSEQRELTDREIQVLRLITKGYKTSEVARLLQISHHTVSTSVRDIYRKLGISPRAEATLEAERRGLVARSGCTGCAD